MDILFASAKLRELCHDAKLAQRQLGTDAAARLAARLDDLSSAANLAICFKLPGRLHALVADRASQFAMSLTKGTRITFKPASEPAPRQADGSIDLNRVTTIEVVFIGNYHD